MKLDSPIAIGRLQAWAAGEPPAVSTRVRSRKRGRVAVVGTGPAGLAAISALADEGIGVDVYEAEAVPGGLITYGIPPYKIDKHKALAEIEGLLQRPGIRVRLVADSALTLGCCQDLKPPAHAHHGA
jgi:glutamate synthase (NADPH/NADH) small chain